MDVQRLSDNALINRAAELIAHRDLLRAERETAPWRLNHLSFDIRQDTEDLRLIGRELRIRNAA